MSLPDNEPAKARPALKAALELYDLHGLNPLAAAIRQKRPFGEWRRWQTERMPRRTVESSFSGGPRNIWVPTGAMAPGSILVLDCDSELAVEYWKERLGDALLDAPHYKTGRGVQFVFRAPPGQEIAGIDGRKYSGTDDEAFEWEVKGDGQGVIFPPSIHPSGKTYTWVRGMDYLGECPPELLEVAFAAPRGVKEALSPGEASRLADLLRSPAVAGGRNNWLAQVAGHLAKYIPYRDAFDVMVDNAAAMCRPPIDDDDSDTPGELTKLKESIWSREEFKRSNLKEAPTPSDDPSDLAEWRRAVMRPDWSTGCLFSGGDCLLVEVSLGGGDTKTFQWLDADFRVLGVISGEDSRSYLVELRKQGEEPRSIVVDSSVFSSTRDTSRWLHSLGLPVHDYRGIQPPLPLSRGDRLSAYLEAQDAPEAKVVKHIGVHRDPRDGRHEFLTHEGVITPGGLEPYRNTRPDPRIAGWAPYDYGFAPEDEARGVLAKVLEFHDDTVTAVFGAWWAAVFLKPFLMRWVSQFPIIGIEAPSESGKTSGFFDMMHRLSGWNESQMNPTRAAMRDYLSGNSCGYVWVDDLDALGDREELIRQVTVGGSMVKKSGDHHGQEVAVMRAALALSGESLGLTGQKALLDRTVLLEAPSPKGRKSKDGSGSQWDEILEFRNEHPDLTMYAGTLASVALRHVDATEQAPKLREGPGRFGDKVAVLRFGARLLERMSGLDGVVMRVDAWCAQQTDTGAENALTLRVLPWALRQTGWQPRPYPPDDAHGMPATPVLLDPEGTVWFSPTLLAHWWKRHQRGQVSQRVESEEAMVQQARALGLGGTDGHDRKNFKFAGTQRAAKYWRCSPDLSEVIVDRSQD